MHSEAHLCARRQRKKEARRTWPHRALADRKYQRTGHDGMSVNLSVCVSVCVSVFVRVAFLRNGGAFIMQAFNAATR